MFRFFTHHSVNLLKIFYRASWSAILGLLTLQAVAADFPGAEEGAWFVKDFRLNSGEMLPELRLAYTTVGTATGEPVFELKRFKSSGMLLIPGTPNTAGHGTIAQAKFWKKDLADLLQSAPRLGE